MKFSILCSQQRAAEHWNKVWEDLSIYNFYKTPKKHHVVQIVMWYVVLQDSKIYLRITLYWFEVIYSSKGHKWTKPCMQNAPPQHNRATRSPKCRAVPAQHFNTCHRWWSDIHLYGSICICYVSALIYSLKLNIYWKNGVPSLHVRLPETKPGSKSSSTHQDTDWHGLTVYLIKEEKQSMRSTCWFIRFTLCFRSALNRCWLAKNPTGSHSPKCISVNNRQQQQFNHCTNSDIHITVYN